MTESGVRRTLGGVRKRVVPLWLAFWRPITTAKHLTAEARADIEELAARADRVTALLLYSDLPQIDIEIEIDRLRESCRLHFPDRMELFRMVYESRWKRFREQGWACEHRRLCE